MFLSLCSVTIKLVRHRCAAGDKTEHTARLLLWHQTALRERSVTHVRTFRSCVNEQMRLYINAWLTCADIFIHIYSYIYLSVFQWSTGYWFSVAIVAGLLRRRSVARLCRCEKACVLRMVLRAVPTISHLLAGADMREKANGRGQTKK